MLILPFYLLFSIFPPRVQNASVHQYLIPIPPFLFGLRMELRSSGLGKHLYPQNHYSRLANGLFFFFTSFQAFNYNPLMIIFVVILDFGFYWLALLWLFASNRMCFLGDVVLIFHAILSDSFHVEVPGEIVLSGGQG